VNVTVTGFSQTLPTNKHATLSTKMLKYYK